ncbi:GspE/PulE family protein [Brevundimonas sp.]|uniref:GspE/PulE family protein n=1 Tax=Brevundimonas sp. TaxID=1871086 RepID=UPI0035AE12FA
MRQRIGERLVERGLITERDLANGLGLQADVGGLLGLILVRLGALSETQLLEVLSEQLDIPILQPEDMPPLEVISGFVGETGSPLGWWANRQAVIWRVPDAAPGEAPLGDLETPPEADTGAPDPIEPEDDDTPLAGAVVCAAVHPLDPALQQRLTQRFPEGVALRLAPRAVVTALHDDLEHGARREVAVGAGPMDAARLRELAQETPVIDFVNGVFAEALTRRASDVHVEPFEDQFFVRMRVDGVLITARTAARSQFDAVCSRIKLLSGMDIGERRLPQDGRQSIRVSGVEVDLRVSSLPSTWGESLVLRLLGKTNRLPTLTELGVSDDQTRLFHQLVEKPNGVMLITGPTGSGKTTTIYRLLTHLNDGDRKIITVEDPVELDLPGVVQVPVKADIGLTFAAGLRSILRQDPDVIMVGEIRDPETARIAVQSALTGHLVISTVHTNSALAAVSRLLDLGIEDYLLADVLRGLAGQRLVRRLCPHCARPSEPHEVEAHEAARPNILGPRRGKADWKEPVGCARCARTGFLGRVGIYEIAPISPAFETGVRQRHSEESLVETARESGFRTMFEDGYLKARRGETTLSEVYRVAGGQAVSDLDEVAA